MSPEKTIQGRVAFEFALAIDAGEYYKAQGMIASSQQKNWPVSKLEETYEDMISYGQSAVNQIRVMETLTLFQMPDRQDHDIGWAYASMAGDDFAEAIAVIVCDEFGKHRIREIEWGRP